MNMKMLLRWLVIFCVTLLIWQLVIWLGNLPPYILPSPYQVLLTGWQQASLLGNQAIVTITEILLGLILGIIFGMSTALLMMWLQPARYWLLPLMIVSQAIPTFAIAPLLVVWFGYGMASKVITTIIMLFFPIASSFYDGLQQTETGWLDLAHTMGANRWHTLIHIRLPAAMPSLATGIRIASTIAPIGAVIGEWVGASKGLGYLMLDANARMQIDLMFAAMFAIMILALVLYYLVDWLLKWTMPWIQTTK